MSEWALKRFWKEVSVETAPEGYCVRLDGRQIRTPAKSPLIVPSRPLADAVAREWDAVEGQVNPADMPMTRSANAAIDKVSIQFEEVADMLAEYGGSDLLCYRAEAPEALCDRQASGWDPLLDWADQRFGARLQVTTGLMPLAQDAAALAKLRQAVHARTVYQLTALHDLVTITGSLVLGLAVAEDRIPATKAFDLSRIDEDWQAEQWGEDAEAVDAAETKRTQLVHAAKLYAMAS